MAHRPTKFELELAMRSKMALVVVGTQLGTYCWDSGSGGWTQIGSGQIESFHLEQTAVAADDKGWLLLGLAVDDYQKVDD